MSAAATIRVDYKVTDDIYLETQAHQAADGLLPDARVLRTARIGEHISVWVDVPAADLDAARQVLEEDDRVDSYTA